MRNVSTHLMLRSHENISGTYIWRIASKDFSQDAFRFPASFCRRDEYYLADSPSKSHSWAYHRCWSCPMRSRDAGNGTKSDGRALYSWNFFRSKPWCYFLDFYRVWSFHLTRSILRFHCCYRMCASACKSWRKDDKRKTSPIWNGCQCIIQCHLKLHHLPCRRFRRNDVD